MRNGESWVSGLTTNTISAYSTKAFYEALNGIPKLFIQLMGDSRVNLVAVGFSVIE